MEKSCIIKQMVCYNNIDYEYCMTIGKTYKVEIEDMGNDLKMYKFLDDNNEFLQTMSDRFKDIK